MAEEEDQFNSRNHDVAVEKINAALGHYKSLVDSSELGIISKDLNGIIQTWNKGAEEIFGYTPEEVIGKPITILFPPERVDEETQILTRIRAGERIEAYDAIRRRKDGALINVTLKISPIKNGEGTIIGASKICRDITEKKQWEQEKKRSHDELKQAKEELEKANRAKDNFLAMLSHELRTPLNPVLLLASDAVTDPALPAVVRASFDTILRNVEMETRLIDDLLDLSRVRTGKLNLEKKKVDLNEVLLNSLSLIKNQAEEKGISLVLDVQASHAAIMGDAIRLQQVFSNVLKNAVKFTPEKGIVTVRAGSTESEYAVSIGDTGIGMTQQELAVAFEAFRQGDNAGASPRFGGLGLGLAISKEFIKYHDGTIEAFSEGSGRGSTFTIRLPLLDNLEGKTEHFRAKDFERGMHLFRNHKIAA